MASKVKSYVQELRENPELLVLNNALDLYFETEKKTGSAVEKAFDKLTKTLETVNKTKLSCSSNEVVEELIEDLFNDAHEVLESLPIVSSTASSTKPAKVQTLTSGISNRGNTCYMASALQLLSSSDVLVDIINKEKDFAGSPLKAALKSNLIALVNEIRRGDAANSAVIQAHFRQIHESPLITGVTAQTFRRFAQDDAFSFMTHLLTQIEADYDNSMRCHMKKIILRGSDPTYNFGPLDIEEKPFVEITTTAAYQGREGQTTTLQALIDNFQSQTEVISDFTYGGTRDHEEIEVVHRLTHPNLTELREIEMVLPRVVKHRTGISSYSLTKLPGKVTGLQDNFSMVIRDQSEGRDYRVALRPKSFVIHLGGSASGGHYIQISRLPSGQFLYKSDAAVREITPEESEELLQTGAQMVVSEVVGQEPV